MKKTYEVGFTTPIRNPEDTNGKWWNYYTAETEEEAKDLFFRETKQNRIDVIEYQIKEVK